ncbi:Fic family protein [Rhizobium calliandrae]|uniref:Fic family protein n=1 Tax=Rhizobium calliandrae TaxID=1312182 RepID=A0ABT7KPV3_9HYPH|nr:Fic family protein [Rhizobium calliandrae]MDL2410650.1 Fic family protein [Rhizobium calliandrae]
MGQKREYLSTHPWLTFSFDLRPISHTAWMNLGEIISKSKHVANAPIDPSEARKLYNVFLAKGAAATTAIEGNTLSEDQVEKQISGKLELPPSQEYLQIEVQNILDACNYLVDSTRDDGERPVTRDFIDELNRLALKNLQLDEGVIAGEVRHHSVVVAGYRGAPVQDCQYLLDELCSHIEEMLNVEPEKKMLHGIFAALFAHAYIALIHPYGDGNGRTSRLLEVYILLRSGFPMPTCQLLSNHYNKTRTAYYRQLDSISKSGGHLTNFIEYAVQGFVDGLIEQVSLIQGEQVRVTWINYIHSKFSEQASPTAKRRRDLAIAISKSPEPRTLNSIFEGDPKTNHAYAHLDDKTLTRDLNVLVTMEIISRAKGKKWRPRVEKIQSFLPWRNGGEA